MRIFRNISRQWLHAQNAIAALLCVGMMLGYMWSRAVLSICILLFFVNALHPKTFKRFWNKWKKDLFAIACFVFFGAYFISGLWSQNTGQWWASTMNKLAFAVLPFSFLSLNLKQTKWRKIIIGFLIVTHVVVVCYSLISFAANYQYYLEHYNQSYSLPTTKYNDHIRFSLSLVATLIVIIYYLLVEKTTFSSIIEKWLLGFTGILFIIYLHILASKTGLLTLYITSFLLAFYFVLKNKKHQKIATGAIIAIILLPVILYTTIPTFKTKMNYVRYEWKKTFSGEELNYTLSDAGRIISYKVASEIVKENLFLGTGAGDIKDKMDAVYEKEFPHVPAENRLIPHNQYLFTLTALGIVLSLSLLFLILTSLLKFSMPNYFGRTTGFIMAMAMMAEAMLEVQFGIFIFLFFILFWKHLPKKSSYYI